MATTMTFTDISLKSDNKIINDKFDFILQEISILFDTAPGEVLGELSFGTEFENFIWNLNASNSQISQYIRDAIINRTTSGQYFDISVDTKLLYGTKSDIILATISIKDKKTNDSTSITYKIDK